MSSSVNFRGCVVKYGEHAVRPVGFGDHAAHAADDVVLVKQRSAPKAFSVRRSVTITGSLVDNMYPDNVSRSARTRLFPAISGPKP